MRTRTFWTGQRAGRGLFLVLALLVMGLLLLGGCGNAGLEELVSSTSLAAKTLASDSPDTVSSSTSSTEAAFQQQEGEIYLEPAGTPGPESFTGETFVPVGPTSTLSIPTTSTVLPPLSTEVTAPTAQLATYSGDTPALYGGSKSKTLVDKEGQLRFFEENPEKAAAFCAALNSDPTFQWSGGTQIQPYQLRDYFAELTPVMLTRDTRVTNHGYRDGRPTPRQSVLQAGQMVLVDRWGIPRVRCECGNPLTPPRPVPTTPRYTGPQWPGFDPTVIIVIQQTTIIIDEFILIDIYTGDTFVRPPGTEGEEDTVDVAGNWHIEVEMVWQDDDNLRVSTITWEADFTVGPDGTLSGAGQGTWHTDGTAFDVDDRDHVVGDWTADATLTVEIGGTIGKDELGPVLQIQPTAGYTVTGVTTNAPGYETGLRESIDGIIPELISEAFVELDLTAGSAGPVYASVVAGGYEGSATLTPLD